MTQTIITLVTLIYLSTTLSRTEFNCSITGMIILFIFFFFQDFFFVCIVFRIYLENVQSRSIRTCLPLSFQLPAASLQRNIPPKYR